MVERVAHASRRLPGTGVSRDLLSALRRPQPLHWAVRLLSSVRFAMVLILAIAALVLAGTIVDQAPASALGKPDVYQEWLERAQARYGAWSPVLERLRLFDVFRSPLFRVLVGTLAVSIVVCTARRWRPIWNTTFHTRTRMNRDYLLRTKFHSSWEVGRPAGDAATAVETALRGARYRVRTENSAGSVAFIAEKNRLSRFGTFFSHLGLVLILAGAVAGGLWGFSDSQFVVAEGSSKALGLGTDLTVRVDRSVDEYYPDGRPKDLRSDLTLLKNGSPVKQGTVLVNSPLRYDGIAFHESFYGQAAFLKVQDADGNVVFREGVPLSLRTTDQRPIGSFELPDLGVSVYITGPLMGQPDTLIRPGEVQLDIYSGVVRAVQPRNLAVGVPVKVGQMTFTFEREGRFAGLKVVKNPGTTIIWVAGALMVFGMGVLFYFPPRRLWALVSERADGTSEVVLGMPAQRDVFLGGAFARLAAGVSQRLGVNSQEDAASPAAKGEDDGRSLV